MSEPNSKNDPAATPDQLIDSGTNPAELSDQELNAASGGTTMNKQKTATKLAEQMDAYIRQ